MMTHSPFRFRHSRRKWTRRGRALVDFTLGGLLAAAEHVAALLVEIGTWSFQSTMILLGKRRRREELSQPTSGRADGGTESQPSQYEPLKGARPGVRFADVAGLEDAKREINLRMILPFRYPKQAECYGVRRGGGLLLYGPPGTGKTMLAKAVATELDASFYHIRPSDILSGQVGQAETNVAQLFETLRRESKAVLFIDEIESLVPSRRKNGSTIMQRVISQFLGEVDGLTPKSTAHTLLLIGATNELEMIDRAMLRPGRFDTKLFIGPPDPDARTKLLESALKDKPVSPNLDLQELVSHTEGMTGAEIVEFINRAADSAFLEDIETDTPQQLHFCSLAKV